MTFRWYSQTLVWTTWRHGSFLPYINSSGWWCNGVGDIFLAHFGRFSTNGALFKLHSLAEYCCSPCPSLNDHSVLIIGWLLPTGQRTMSRSWTHLLYEHDNEFTVLQWSPQPPDLNPTAPCGCGGTGDLHHGGAANKSAVTVWCNHDMDQKEPRNVSNTLLNLHHEELRQFWGQTVQPGKSKVDLSDFVDLSNFVLQLKATLPSSWEHCWKYSPRASRVTEASSSYLIIHLQLWLYSYEWRWFSS